MRIIECDGDNGVMIDYCVSYKPSKSFLRLVRQEQRGRLIVSRVQWLLRVITKNSVLIGWCSDMMSGSISRSHGWSKIIPIVFFDRTP